MGHFAKRLTRKRNLGRQHVEFNFSEVDLLLLLCNNNMQFPFGKFTRGLFFFPLTGEVKKDLIELVLIWADGPSSLLFFFFFSLVLSFEKIWGVSVPVGTGIPERRFADNGLCWSGGVP